MRSYLQQQVNRQGDSRYIMGIEMATDYFNLRYKYLIVPVWINSFFYDNKLYTIVINGQWPKSFGKFAQKAALFLLGGGIT